LFLRVWHPFQNHLGAHDVAIVGVVVGAKEGLFVFVVVGFLGGPGGEDEGPGFFREVDEDGVFAGLDGGAGDFEGDLGL
jgi:hypothetical protein